MCLYDILKTNIHILDGYLVTCYEGKSQLIYMLTIFVCNLPVNAGELLACHCKNGSLLNYLSNKTKCFLNRFYLIQILLTHSLFSWLSQIAGTPGFSKFCKKEMQKTFSVRPGTLLVQQ